MLHELKVWLLTTCLGKRGWFNYYGARLYFPPGSLVFRMAIEQGTYERDVVHILTASATPESTFFDVGGNIGLVAAPLLAKHPTLRVISFEPSPNTLPFLQRSIAASCHGDRWQLVPKAVGARCGHVSFAARRNAANGAYDGIKDTGQGGPAELTTVEMTTIDTEWQRLGCPRISVIKIDVEGAELACLEGARQCLAQCRPRIVLEWGLTNLASNGCPPDALLHFARETDYLVANVATMLPLENREALLLQMCQTANFLLVSRQDPLFASGKS